MTPCSALLLVILVLTGVVALIVVGAMRQRREFERSMDAIEAETNKLYQAALDLEKRVKKGKQ